MLNDPLAATLAKIMNAEKVGKREVVVKPASKMIRTILSIMNDHRFIGSHERIEDGKGGALKVSLLGNINRCGVVKPRFSTKHNGYEKWEKRYLPAKDFGLLFISTSQGVMIHIQAKEKKIGGKLFAYCY